MVLKDLGGLGEGLVVDPWVVGFFWFALVSVIHENSEHDLVTDPLGVGVISNMNGLLVY